MNLLQLRYFKVVARHGNVSRAAEELLIAQSSLSETISKLERDLGVQLFDRHGRKIHLNAYGKIFLSRVDKCLFELDEGIREVDELLNLTHKQIVIGCTIPYMLPEIIAEYLPLFPSIEIELLEIRDRQRLSQLLINGEIDLCISTLPFHTDNIDNQELVNEEIYYVVNENHVLSTRKSINLSEVENEPFIPAPHDSELLEIVDQLFMKVGFAPRIVLNAPTPEIICKLVKDGVGNTLLPESWQCRLNTDSLVKLHVNFPICERTIWLSWSCSNHRSDTIMEFMKFLVDHLFM